MNFSFHILLFFLAFVYGGMSHAQAIFVPGYVISAKGDTMRGEVKVNPKKEIDNFSRVCFKDASGNQKNYRPSKVLGYGFDKKDFVTKGEEEEALFYERMTNGPIILYKSSFESVHMNQTVKELAYYLYKEGDKKMTDVKETKFKKQIMEWMEDEPEIASDYPDEKKFLIESAVSVINKYNEWKKGH